MQLLKKLREKDIYGLSGSNSGRKAQPEGTWTVTEKRHLRTKYPQKKLRGPDSRGEKGSPGSNSRFSETEKSLRVIAFEPKTDRDYLGQGQRLYHEEGKASEAEASFKKALELNPKNEQAYLELGQLYRLQDKLSQAEDIIKKVIKLNPENDNAYHALGGFTQIKGNPYRLTFFSIKLVNLGLRKLPRSIQQC